jgi:cytochrome c556
MHGGRYVLVVIAAIGALWATAAAPGETADDGKAVFARRQDTMKRMGRPLYLGIGRVVKGKASYGPDTVAAAETVASLASTLDPTLFAPGSNVAESRMKPEIFADSAHVEQLIAAVQTAAGKLIPAAKTDDKPAITSAYNAVVNACNDCHTEFRKEE